jgi:protein TonB
MEHPREGTVVLLLSIGLTGRVEACQVTRSGGLAELDRAACRSLRSRARFEPARGRRCRAVPGQYPISVTFRMPAE